MDSFSAAEVDHVGNIKLKCNNPVHGDLIDSALETPGSKLCEDELSLIFNHHIIAAKDLLNFRLVNKSWRDAATRILLKRDACIISLAAQVVIEVPEYTGNGLANPVRFCFRKRGDADANLNELSQLTELFSNSPKFPSSNIHLHLRGRYRYRWDELLCYDQHSDLLLFVKLHGDKIKRLTPHGRVSQEHVRDFLGTYAPKLECLDLSDANLMPSCPKFKEQVSLKKWTSKPLPVKSLVIPLSPRFVYDVDYDEDEEGSSDDDNETKATYHAILHLLLSSPSNLSCIENVHVNAVPYILKEKKGHLIKGFEFTSNPTTDITSQRAISLLQQVVAVNPQLSKLTLETTINSYFTDWPTSMNALLKSSKDTLQELELSVQPVDHFTRLKIFQMKNLSFVTLRGPSRDDPIAQVSCMELDCTIFEEKTSAAKCFPALVKLRLANVPVKESCKSFFQFKLDEDGRVRGGDLPKLEVLEIIDCSMTENSDSVLMSKYFPNIRLLKISSEDLRVKNSLWRMFPLVEFIEIKISFSRSHYFNSPISWMDEFFTGFPHEFCQKLLTTQLPDFMNNPEGLKFLRIKPSVCDLQNLKELKLKISSNSKSKPQVLSHVTGAYAFSQLPNTKFVVAYNFNTKTCKDDVEAESCFASIKPYAQILHEK